MGLKKRDRGDDAQNNPEEAGTESKGEKPISVAGRITNDQKEGVSEAHIEILETGQRTFSDNNGDYSLGDVVIGDYTIRVIATGFKANIKKLEVSSKLKTYDVVLEKT